MGFSEMKEPKLHKLGVFWANYCKKHPIWAKLGTFLSKMVYWWVSNWIKDWYTESQICNVQQAHPCTILAKAHRCRRKPWTEVRGRKKKAGSTPSLLVYYYHRGGGNLYFGVDIILIKGLSKCTLSTYFPSMKIDPNFACFSLIFPCPFQNL